MHNYSELEAVFTDYDERYAPKEDSRALSVSLVGDIMYFYVGRYTETCEDGKATRTFVETESVGVDAEQFVETLNAIIRREQRRAADLAESETRIKLDDLMRQAKPE